MHCEVRLYLLCKSGLWVLGWVQKSVNDHSSSSWVQIYSIKASNWEARIKLVARSGSAELLGRHLWMRFLDQTSLNCSLNYTCCKWSVWHQILKCCIFICLCWMMFSNQTYHKTCIYLKVTLFSWILFVLETNSPWSVGGNMSTAAKQYIAHLTLCAWCPHLALFMKL